jgi:dihydroxyacetone kinase-like predicted kinase
VAVIPSKTAPQGFSAMMALNPDVSLAATAAAMQDAMSYVATGEITRATRSVELDGVAVNEGEIIGVVDGRLSASGTDLAATIVNVRAKMEMDDRELVSLYYGQDVTEADATAVADQIEELYPDVEVEILPGGQAHYFYILGAE